jgi:hypothetical protein
MEYQSELWVLAHSLEVSGLKVVPRTYMPEMQYGAIYMTAPGLLGKCAAFPLRVQASVNFLMSLALGLERIPSVGQE